MHLFTACRNQRLLHQELLYCKTLAHKCLFCLAFRLPILVLPLVLQNVQEQDVNKKFSRLLCYTVFHNYRNVVFFKKARILIQKTLENSFSSLSFVSYFNLPTFAYSVALWLLSFLLSFCENSQLVMGGNRLYLASLFFLGVTSFLSQNISKHV